MNFKFKTGDEVVVARREEYNWCKVGDRHTVRIAKVVDSENVYVVDDHHDGIYIPECNLEFVNAKLIVPRGTIDPIKMRDTIIELEAYEEHFSREREELTIGLLAEGFVLVKALNESLDKLDSGLSASDPKGWGVGDSLKCLTSIAPSCYTVGNTYKVMKVGEEGFDLCISDNYGRDSFCGFDFDEIGGDDYVFTKVVEG